MISRIYKVSRDKDTNTMATDLATLFSNTQDSRRKLVEIKEFYQNQPNPYNAGELESLQAPSLELGSFFFLGHTDDRTFGGFSVEEFASHFDQPFEAQKKKLFQDKRPFKYEDKAQVRDLYIFGCEAGLANQGKNDSYAQRLANEFHEKGFVNARVHAVAYEKQAPGETMYTEVIWEAGLGDKQTQHGFISAHSLDENTASEIRLLRHVQENTSSEASKALAETKIKHYYSVAKARRKPIADAVSPLEFLTQAENTFIAKESYKQRMTRIAQDPEYKEREKRKRVIELVTPMKDEKNLDDGKKNILLRFLHALKTNYVSTCDQICTSFKNEYKKLITFLGHTPKSKTLDLLEQLSQGKIPSQSATSPASEVELTGSVYSEEEEKKPLLSPRSPLRSNDLRHRPGLFPAPALKPEDKIPEQLMTEIESLHELLENEISLLQDRMERSCFALFISHEINTKAQKRDCLQDLKQAKTLGDLQAKAKTALEDSRITRHFRNTCTKEWGKSRTRDLLNEIIKDPRQEAKLRLA